MKRALTAFSLCFSMLAFGQVVINEASSKNTSSLQDEDAEYSDWLELYNTSPSTSDLNGFYLSDNKDSLDKWLIGDAQIESDGHLLIFASGKDRSFSSSTEKVLDAAYGNHYGYADIDQGGGSTIEPLHFKSIMGVENNRNVFSAKMTITDNSGTLGYQYAGVYIQQGNWGQINDYSDFNVIRIKADITAGMNLELRVVTDGVNSWEGFRTPLLGTGQEKEYIIPLFNNAMNMDLSKITGVQFEGNDIGVTEFKITEIEFESRSKIEALSSNHFYYTDTDQGGNSTLVPNEFATISAKVNGYNALSATIDYAENNPVLTYSYATIQNKIFNWDDSLNLSGYDNLLVHANIEAGKNIKIALLQHGTEDWLTYGRVLTGSGQDSTYVIPLTGSVAPLDLTQLKGITVEGVAPYGPRSFTIHKMEFEKKTGLNEGHTNFRLEGSGETIYLTDGTNILDSLELPRLSDNISYGRIGDGANELGVFEMPTPNATNNSPSYNGLCLDTIQFNTTPGFYTAGTTVELTGSASIHYTTDGTAPTTQSDLYTAPIVLNATTVIKASCFSNNTLAYNTSIATYIIDEDTELPVFSITSDPDNFFSDEKGILADGPGWTEEMPHFGANFWEDWKIPAHMEFFDENGVLQLNQDIGVKVFGGWSRAQDQKSLRLIADKDYGDNDFDYQFFEHKNIESFKHIVLRNSGNDFNGEHFHDAISHVALRDIDHEIDNLEYQPAVVFLNGEYWGIMNIREKINEHYIRSNHGVDKDDVELYDSWGQHIHNGSEVNNIYEVSSFASNNDLSIQANYDHMASIVDIDNLIDNFAVDIFISNWDWPQNNLKYWRPFENGVYGKYRYIFFDKDITFGKFGLQDPSFNQISRIMNYVENPHANIFSNLMSNITFRNRFINRSADMMNTVLSEDNLNNVIDNLMADIAAEVPKHTDRWPRWDGTWVESVQGTRDFIAIRETTAWTQLRDEFSLPDIHTVLLNINDVNAGQIKINSITPALPWTGDYYESVPITLIPQAFAGYTFDHWETSLGDVFSDTLTVNLLRNEPIVAHFIGASQEINLVVSEVNYNSSIDIDYKDYVELYNASSAALDISGFVLKDDKDYHQYIIPEGTTIDANAYLVLAEFPAFITTKQPTVADKVIGGYDFGFGSGGDNIRLYDQYGNEIINMVYDDKTPWPIEADGAGYTLENDGLLTESLSDAATWVAGCYGGSPGVAYDPVNCLVGLQSEVIPANFYPNPASSTLHLEDGIDGYNIYTSQGTPVMNGKNSIIDVSELSAGSYIIEVVTNEQSQRSSFIKL